MKPADLWDRHDATIAGAVIGRGIRRVLSQ
jgi:hypothetical protein